MANTNNYNAESIKSLNYFEHIRQYPGMYIGSKDINGLHHLAKEVISNSIDEYLNGAGDTIIVKIQADGGFYVEDNGRGIPIGEHSKGISTLRACYGVENTGGKFNNATGATGYNTSGGEHGTGLKAVNALSRKLIATTSRDGVRETVEFSRGKYVTGKKEKSNSHGVTTLFYPDEEILETVTFDSNKIKSMVQEFSFLCSGLTFKFIDEKLGIEETFYSDKGLNDFIYFLNKGKEFSFPPIYFYEKEGNFQLEVAVGYNKSYGGIIKLYTNNIPQEKGTHLTGFKTAWTTQLNQFARAKGWLKEKEENLSGSDYEEGQILILNFKMIDPVFKGQNKEELSSSEGRVLVQKLTTQALKEYFVLHEKDVKILFDKAINARKAREAAKKARDAVRGTEKKKEKKLLNLPSKLIDAYSKKRKECELLIVEGDSAAGGLVEARNPETMAIFPIRGKIISVYKNSNEKIFANQEVVNIIKAIGLEMDKKTGKLIYDETRLRYGKIVLCADADPDGQAIKNLLLELFWWLCPDLVRNGHIYAAVPPLFRITTKKNKYIFLKDQKALEEYKNSHVGESYLVNRNKG